MIAPYDFCDGTCEFCRKGLDSACQQGGVWGYGHEGGQADQHLALHHPQLVRRLILAGTGAGHGEGTQDLNC